MGRFVYFYIMKGADAKIRETVPRHVAYWKSLKLDDYLGGPFADRSGGLISFSAEGFDAARVIGNGDPFVEDHLLLHSRIKEWIPE
jgi:uncharacterized protein YciI